MSVGSVLLWILAGILAVLLALLVLPVGVRVCYDVSGLRICLLAGPIRWQLLPAKSKWWFKRRTKDKPAPPARPAGKPAGKPKPAHKGGAWSNLKPYLPVFRNLLLGLRRRLLVRRLEFWVKLGGDDPCDLAIRYGPGMGLPGGFAAPPGPGPSHPAKGCPGGLRLYRRGHRG